MSSTALAETTAVSLEAWGEFLKSLAAGTAPAEAMKEHRILSREIESMLLSPLESQRWREARMAGKASRWPVFEREEILSRIAAGTAVERAIIEVRGAEHIESDLSDWFELVEALPEFRDRYAAAMRAKGLRESLHLVEIADDVTLDTLPSKHGDIPNMAAVQRAKLRIETRQHLMARWHPTLFGEKQAQVNVQINVNQAERLENARARVKNLRDPPQLAKRDLKDAIDAVFSETPTPSKAEREKAAPAPEPRAEAPSEPASCLDE